MTEGGEGDVVLRQRLSPEEWRSRMADDVREGLGSRPKTLPPKYFYDARGSRLFERITRLPEYYQTRTERRILERAAGPLVDEVRPRAAVEFGSGSAGKTRVLADAMHRAGLLSGYGPVDVSREPVREACREFARRYPGIRLEGIIADFEDPIPLPFGEEPRLILFLGSTIGNLTAPRARRFLSRVAGQMDTGDAFLLGFDLVKEEERLVRAYDDAAGVTADFNRNVLRVLNRELGAEFEPDRFRHRAVWNGEASRIEMHLEAGEEHTVQVRELEMEVSFRRGETIRTELSHKYTRESVEELLESAGLRLSRWETDGEELFAVGLARRR